MSNGDPALLARTVDPKPRTVDLSNREYFKRFWRLSFVKIIPSAIVFALGISMVAAFADLFSLKLIQLVIILSMICALSYAFDVLIFMGINYRIYRKNPHLQNEFRIEIGRVGVAEMILKFGFLKVLKGE